jgi:hypothetical protein
MNSMKLGQTYISTDDRRGFIWKSDKFLTDGMHVVLVGVDEPKRRKTVSLWALENRRLFTPIEPQAA